MVIHDLDDVGVYCTHVTKPPWVVVLTEQYHIYMVNHAQIYPFSKVVIHHQHMASSWCPASERLATVAFF